MKKKCSDILHSRTTKADDLNLRVSLTEKTGGYIAVQDVLHNQTNCAWDGIKLVIVIEHYIGVDVSNHRLTSSLLYDN